MQMMNMDLERLHFKIFVDHLIDLFSTQVGPECITHCSMNYKVFVFELINFLNVYKDTIL